MSLMTRDLKSIGFDVAGASGADDNLTTPRILTYCSFQGKARRAIEAAAYAKSGGKPVTVDEGTPFLLQGETENPEAYTELPQTVEIVLIPEKCAMFFASRGDDKSVQVADMESSRNRVLNENFLATGVLLLNGKAIPTLSLFDRAKHKGLKKATAGLQAAIAASPSKAPPLCRVVCRVRFSTAASKKNPTRKYHTTDLVDYRSTTDAEVRAILAAEQDIESLAAVFDREMASVREIAAKSK